MWHLGNAWYDLVLFNTQQVCIECLPCAYRGWGKVVEGETYIIMGEERQIEETEDLQIRLRALKKIL